MDVAQAVSVARMSDVGLMRSQNEDSVASDLTTGLIMVADGMGGYKAGEIASQMTTLIVAAELAELMHEQALTRKMLHLPVKEMLKRAVAIANSRVYQISQEQPVCSGMGTTMVAGVLYNNKVIVGHIGDSRLYRFREGVLEQLTEDHSLLQEQIKAGLISKEQARMSNDGHLVTRALGTEAEVDLELNEYDVLVGDCYLLCSDGLTDLVEDDEIQETIASANGNTQLAASSLIRLANKYGGTDNVSVVIASVKDSFAMKQGWIHKLWG
jgi:PPM family protein phosphatase